MHVRDLVTSRSLVGLTATLLLVAAAARAADEQRPRITVSDAACGCPSVEGAFVALLDPDRGMLLLSGASFPGGRRAGEVRGEPIGVALPGGEQWWLEDAGSGQGAVPLWAARYGFHAAKGRGCVGFDRSHWSSEGDLVTYLRWLVEEVYLQLPETERGQGLRLEGRELTLLVEREGFGVLRLSGREGSTLACRYAGSEQLWLLMPFVLDAATGRVAVRVSVTEGSYFDRQAKQNLGWVVATPDAAGTLAEMPLSITVERPDTAPQ